eukprot:UN28725
MLARSKIFPRQLIYIYVLHISITFLLFSLPFVITEEGQMKFMDFVLMMGLSLFILTVEQVAQQSEFPFGDDYNIDFPLNKWADMIIDQVDMVYHYSTSVNEWGEEHEDFNGINFGAKKKNMPENKGLIKTGTQI